MGRIEITPVDLTGSTAGVRVVSTPKDTITISVDRIVCTEPLDSYPNTPGAERYCIVRYDYPLQSGNVTTYVVNENYAAFNARAKREHHAWQAHLPAATGDDEDA